MTLNRTDWLLLAFVVFAMVGSAMVVHPMFLIWLLLSGVLVRRGLRQRHGRRRVRKVI